MLFWKFILEVLHTVSSYINLLDPPDVAEYINFNK